MLNSLVIGHNRNVIFATVNVPSQSNEDRASSLLTHEAATTPGKDIMSFAVMDGHNGNYAAQFCADRTNQLVAELFNQYSNRPVVTGDDKYLSVLDEQDRVDIHMCQAINESIDLSNKHIRNTAAAGSTFCSLYLVPINDELTGACSMRVYCANVGDSRCVMVTTEEATDSLIAQRASSSLFTIAPYSRMTAAMSDPYSMSLHGASSDSEDSFSLSFSSHSASPSRKGIIEEGNGSRKLFSSGLDTMVFPLPSRDAVVEEDEAMGEPSMDLSMKGRPRSVVVQQVAFSEDHSMQCTRELRRISEKIPLQPLSLPIPLEWGGSTDRIDSLQQVGSEAELAAITSRVCKVSKRGDPIVLQKRTQDVLSDDDVVDDIDITSHSIAPAPSSDNSTSSTAEQHYSNHSSYSWLKANRNSNQLRCRSSSSSSLPDLSLSDPSYSSSSSPSHPADLSMEQQHPRYSPEVILDPNSILLPVFSPHSQLLQTTQLLSRSQQIYLFKLYAASRYRIQQELLSSPSSSSSSVLVSFIASTNSHSNTAEPPISLQPTKSFVDYRKSSDGLTVGPLAFFGSSSHSLLMTRSIGDRLGPRGCIALPDITVHTIPSNKHARFILASDGFWDVVSSENVRQWALHYAYQTPQDLAVMLAVKARKLRKKNEIRMDDITVTVVDINIQNAVFVQSEKCRINVPKRVVKCSDTDAFINDLTQDKCPLMKVQGKNKHCIVVPVAHDRDTNNIRTSKSPSEHVRTFKHTFDYKPKNCIVM